MSAYVVFTREITLDKLELATYSKEVLATLAELPMLRLFHAGFSADMGMAPAEFRALLDRVRDTYRDLARSIGMLLENAFGQAVTDCKGGMNSLRVHYTRQNSLRHTRLRSIGQLKGARAMVIAR